MGSGQIHLFYEPQTFGLTNIDQEVFDTAVHETPLRNLEKHGIRINALNGLNHISVIALKCLWLCTLYLKLKKYKLVYHNEKSLILGFLFHEVYLYIYTR